MGSQGRGVRLEPEENDDVKCGEDTPQIRIDSRDRRHQGGGRRMRPMAWDKSSMKLLQVKIRCALRPIKAVSKRALISAFPNENTAMQLEDRTKIHYCNWR